MSNFYTHLSIFFFLFVASAASILLSLWVSFRSPLLFSFSFLRVWNLPLSITIFLDQFSCWFMRVVLAISSVIIVYSFFYMSPYTKSTYFLSLTLLFILSMLLVICFSNLIFIMLGWDGLGLVSFFLIVYYQNPSSVFSGVFTLLINRIGDAFFLCSIVLYCYLLPDFFVFTSSNSSVLLTLFLILTFITKRAIFPFSPWLPIAIAAPTPISALVHSSTLVTSGLFLMMKYSYVLYSSPHLMQILLVTCVFTSFYAGLNTFCEIDYKKLIALSTLSHLGFIGIAFSIGLLNLSFFHLLTHALFKSVLFMSIGEVMISIGHSQDMRHLSLGGSYTPFSCFIINISLLNLIGFPRLSGFLSKDLILESLNFTNCSSLVFYLNLLNLSFTFYYSFRLLYYSFQLSKLSPYSLVNPILEVHSCLVAFLSLTSLFFGHFFVNSFFLCFYPTVPFLYKIFPLSLLFLFFIFLLLNKRLWSSKSQLLSLYFSSIIFLFYFITRFSSNFYYKSSFWVSKSLELGLFNSILNSKLPSAISYFSFFVLKWVLYSPFYITFSSLTLVFLTFYFY